MTHTYYKREGVITVMPLTIEGGATVLRAEKWAVCDGPRVVAVKSTLEAALHALREAGKGTIRPV